jgi:hypothetical protein
MFDSESLRPVIIAMAIYIAMSHLMPKFITKPTSIKPVDDINMLLISQQGSLMAGSLLVGLIVFLTNYVNLELI